MATTALLKKIVITAIGTAAIGAGVASSAEAATLTVGETWSSFEFGGEGSIAYDYSTGDTSWNFSIGLGKIGLLQVTDAFLKGDIFSVFNFGALLGQTSQVLKEDSWVGDPNIAFTDPGFSSGTFKLGAGDHSISLLASVSPWGAGGAYFRVLEVDAPEEEVPEPVTILGTLAFGAMGFAAKNKRKQQKG